MLECWETPRIGESEPQWNLYKYSKKTEKETSNKVKNVYNILFFLPE